MSSIWLGVVPELVECSRHGLVDELHRAPADELLRLHERELGLDAGRVAVHHEADRAGGCQHRGLRVPEAVHLAERDRLVPRLLRRREHGLGHELRIDLVGRRTVLADHPDHGVSVGRVSLERAHHLGDAGARAVGLSGHDGRDRPRPRPAPVGVVGQPSRHEQRAEVRVAEAQLPEGPRVLGDLLGRVIGLADHDLLRCEHDLDRVLEARDVERAVVVQELHQVERGQVARAVVEVHVLRARVRAVDAAGGRARVPLVDRRVVLHAGVGALPGRVGDLAHQVARAHRGHRLTRRDGLELPVLVLLEGAHELVGDPHRVVRVLILDRRAVLAVEVHVEPGVAQGAGLPLLVGLAPDEVLDVGMVDVQDHHLRGAPGLAAGLDRAGRGVGPSHEAHRAARRAATRERLLRGTDPGQVDARAGPALEDRAFLDVPVEDRRHAVVDRQDETGGALLRRVGHAHVEPDR